MGLGDEKLMFSEAQAILLAADEASTDHIDFQDEPHNLGVGTDLSLELVVTTTFTGLDSGMRVIFQSDEDDGFATDLQNNFTSRTLAVAELVAGARFIFPVPTDDLQRYVRGWYDLISEVATAGAVTLRIIAGKVRRTV